MRQHPSRAHADGMHVEWFAVKSSKAHQSRAAIAPVLVKIDGEQNKTHLFSFPNMNPQ
jgi:hypothetical protein